MVKFRKISTWWGNERRPTQQCPPGLSGETEKTFFNLTTPSVSTAAPFDDEMRGQKVGEEGGALLNV